MIFIIWEVYPFVEAASSHLTPLIWSLDWSTYEPNEVCFNLIHCFYQCVMMSTESMIPGGFTLFYAIVSHKILFHKATLFDNNFAHHSTCRRSNYCIVSMWLYAPLLSMLGYNDTRITHGVIETKMHARLLLLILHATTLRVQLIAKNCKNVCTVAIIASSQHFTCDPLASTHNEHKATGRY